MEKNLVPTLGSVSSDRCHICLFRGTILFILATAIEDYILM